VKIRNTQQAIINRKIRKLFSIVVCALLIALCPSADAQQSNKVAQIAFLGGTGTPVWSSRIDSLRQGLRQLGYVEKKNIMIMYRPLEELNPISTLRAELARLKIDVIVTAGSSATRAAKEAGLTIPIVMAQDPDPVGNQFVASLARPGGNITGLSSLAADLSGKRLELLKEILPKIARVVVFGTSTFPGNAQALKEMELAAGTLGVKLQFVDVLTPKDIETAFREADKERADAAIAIGGFVLSSQLTPIVETAAKRRLPVMYHQREYVEAGGLVSYGVSVADLYRRAATYVDKILKGAKPADLPVEQPTKYEMLINLKPAKQIGLTIPPNVLARADRVIK
jgi:putative ABC transport system substrate-binding protein